MKYWSLNLLETSGPVQTFNGIALPLHLHKVNYWLASLTPLATGWTVGGSNPGGGEIFRTCPDWPWGPPSLLCNGYWVFPGIKERPGRDADLSPPYSAVGRKTVELHLYSPYGPYGLYRASVPVQG